jgi:hypothetical protein
MPVKTIVEFLREELARPEVVAAGAKLGMTNFSVDPMRVNASHNFIDIHFHALGRTDMYLTIGYTFFAACCGIRIIHEIRLLPSFFNTFEFEGERIISLQRRGFGTFLFHAFMNASIAQAAAKPHSGPGWFISATTNLQPAGHQIMQKMRWKAVEVFRNPNSGNIITVWKKKLTTAKYDNLPKEEDKD